MKTEFKAKFLQHVAKRKREEGFTLIELLVVIIIIGILSAIALPSFLNQANKAKQSEAKQYISSMNKGLQAFYAENSKFKDGGNQDVEVSDLGLGIKTQTTNYKYELQVADIAPNTVPVSSTAKPVNQDLRAFAGGVGLIEAGEANTTTTILCEEKASAGDFNATVGKPAVNAGKLECAGTQTEVTK